jgi:hypothetical protein
MSFPSNTTQVSTDNLDAGSDNPALARGDLLLAVQLVNEIVAGQNDAGGVSVLDGQGRVPNTRLPQSITWNGGGNQIINPTTGIVELNSVLRLAPLTKSAIQSVTTATLQQGMIAFCSNLTTTTSGVVYYDGTNWKTVSTSGNL